ncbi:MAG TPA: hypothetical protein VLV89_14030 [Candidatus Acidoferrum sp.]|nr:hypothetical protein [Candidatus Acidoferrum sp.]
MKIATLSILRQFAIPAACGVLVALAAAHSGRGAAITKNGVPDDWTHHRLIFSNPGSAEEARKRGTYNRWLEITNDARFTLQQIKRSSMEKSAPFPWIHAPHEEESGCDGNAERSLVDRNRETRVSRGLHESPTPPRLTRVDHEPCRKTPRVHTDWSEDMGPNASSGLGVFPAKYSFNTGSANCGNSASPDFVVYNTGLTGSGTQANIIAYDNLYTPGCTTGSVPTVYWAYNTNGGTITTSVVLSGDGSQVAFIQSTAGVASLTILKWSGTTGGSASSPDTLSNTAAGSFRSCPIPCMTSIAFANGANDSGSAPYYDYSTDSIYVGDDTGKLHKFTGVFTNTPAEVTTSWPVSVSSSALSGPVYDSASGNIFVGDYLQNTSSTCALSGNPCGYLYSVKASSGTVVGQSSRLDFISGIVDSPLVDSSAGMVYVFVGADGESGVSSACGTDIPCAGVFQFPVSFTSGSGTEATVGPGFEFLMSGAFDNEYFTSATPSTPTGHLYVVGNTGAANNTLFQISINSNVMSTTATAGPAVSDSYTAGGYFSAGLQVTEFLNGMHDYIFLSVLSYGSPSGCTSSLTEGCVMGFDVTSGTINGSTAPSAAATEAGGTSGIIIDNSAALSGAANIYFTTLLNQTCTTSGGTGGCAIQTLQSAP